MAARDSTPCGAKSKSRPRRHQAAASRRSLGSQLRRSSRAALSAKPWHRGEACRALAGEAAPQREAAARGCSTRRLTSAVIISAPWRRPFGLAVIARRNERRAPAQYRNSHAARRRRCLPGASELKIIDKAYDDHGKFCWQPHSRQTVISMHPRREARRVNRRHGGGA